MQQYSTRPNLHPIQNPTNQAIQSRHAKKILTQQNNLTVQSSQTYLTNACYGTHYTGIDPDPQILKKSIKFMSTARQCSNWTFIFTMEFRFICVKKQNKTKQTEVWIEIDLGNWYLSLSHSDHVVSLNPGLYWTPIERPSVASWVHRKVRELKGAMKRCTFAAQMWLNHSFAKIVKTHPIQFVRDDFNVNPATSRESQTSRYLSWTL